MKYEQILTELEKISVELDSKDISLSDSIELFEKSVKLAKEGYDILNSSNGKITVIKKELDSFIEKPL